MNTPEYYEIRVQGHLGTGWATWFDGLSIRHEDTGETVLAGRMEQPALHGALMKIRDLNLPLVSVSRVEDEASWLVCPEEERE